ncbi:MAG: hypothetical protein QM730_12580 [Anaerolineales bacterium]
MRKLILPTLSLILLLSLSTCGSLPISTPAAPSGTILFQDTFETNLSGWDRLANDGGIMDYDGGGFRILIRQPNMNYWSTPEKNYSDVRVEADVTRLNGPEENRAGLICRYQNGDYYFFIISNDGFYGIGKFIGGQTLLLGQTVMQPSELILRDGINHVRADCVGNTLTLYVNFTQVATAQDSDFANGDVGILAGAFTQPGVDMLFQNFVAMQP